MVKKILMSLFICLCLLFTSCVSNRGVNRDILEYQKEIDRLESELRARDRAIESAIDSVERIKERSENVSGGIDEIIDLFDEYQRAVERMLQEYRKTGTEK